MRPLTGTLTAQLHFKRRQRRPFLEHWSSKQILMLFIGLTRRLRGFTSTKTARWNFKNEQPFLGSCKFFLHWPKTFLLRVFPKFSVTGLNSVAFVIIFRNGRSSEMSGRTLASHTDLLKSYYFFLTLTGSAIWVTVQCDTKKGFHPEIFPFLKKILHWFRISFSTFVFQSRAFPSLSISFCKNALAKSVWAARARKPYLGAG